MYVIDICHNFSRLGDLHITLEREHEIIVYVMVKHRWEITWLVYWTIKERLFMCNAWHVAGWNTLFSGVTKSMSVGIDDGHIGFVNSRATF